MDVATLRAKLHQYIDKADEVNLTVLYEFAGHIDDTPDHYDIATIAIWHERRNKHLQGRGKSYTANESISLIKAQKK